MTLFYAPLIYRIYPILSYHTRMFGVILITMLNISPVFRIERSALRNKVVSLARCLFGLNLKPLHLSLLAPIHSYGRSCVKSVVLLAQDAYQRNLCICGEEGEDIKKAH